MRFSSSEITFPLRFAPAITVSILSSKSLVITLLRLFLTALRAASFTIFANSAPDAPDVARAIKSKSISSCCIFSNALVIWLFVPPNREAPFELGGRTYRGGEAMLCLNSRGGGWLLPK